MKKRIPAEGCDLGIHMYGSLAMREGSALPPVSKLPPPSASLRTHANGKPFAVSLAERSAKKKMTNRSSEKIREFRALREYLAPSPLASELADGRKNTAIGLTALPSPAETDLPSISKLSPLCVRFTNPTSCLWHENGFVYGGSKAKEHTEVCSFAFGDTDGRMDELFSLEKAESYRN